ncbi:MAG: tRNA (adenosine(37)-N6)-threonylcarbamoyltransferase complex ATPase subunit type 1 TsaE [Thermodesulfovibrionaceae bacterium]
MRVYTYSEKETKKFGKIIGAYMKQEGINILALYGEMGAGKTVITKGVAEAFGLNEKDIMSSSFIIVSSYPEQSFYHIDLYRVNDPEELDLWEYFESGVCVIEWAEKLKELPERSLKLKIELIDENTRLFVLD